MKKSPKQKTAPPPDESNLVVLRNQFPAGVKNLADLLIELQSDATNSKTLNQIKAAAHELHDIASLLKQPAIRIVTDKLNQFLNTHVTDPKSTLQSDALNELKNHITLLKEITNIHLESDKPFSAPQQGTKIHHLLIGIHDKQMVEEIVSQVKYFNYTCTDCDSLEEMSELVAKSPDKYSAILLDIDYCPSRDPNLIQPISDIVPVLFISFDESVASRLFAVQSGGSAYLVRPLEFTSLIEKVDAIAHKYEDSTPYRVLIIEDSSTQATFISQHLKNAGITTEVVTEPLEINKVLQEFQPELILMDLYMPKCSGFDLTLVIRQQDPFTSIPIVYLSAEEDVDTQLHAITIGGDDFLTKPIDPEHLVSSVKARTERARTLRAEMIQDSLTGLLNHTRILEQLDLEIARAKRNHLPLVFAMIDIDFFKTINDNHGHPVGDRVIKGLARLLKQRLRKTDSIGRYGGEEFALILPQSEIEVMVPLLDSIRRSFSKLLHQSGDPLVEFTATFSCGLAEYSTENNTVGKIVQAADRALYKAKNSGRNCIMLDDNNPS